MFSSCLSCRVSRLRYGTDPLLRLILINLRECAGDAFVKESVNQSDSRGFTPLHEACLSGHNFTAQSLLENGAERQPLTNDGITPVDLASKMAKRENEVDGMESVDVTSDKGHHHCMKLLQEDDDL